MKTINLISGPRNLSTALMYSFAQREDCKVVDEPFYAYYLTKGNVLVSHPGTAEILASLPQEKDQVLMHLKELQEQQNKHLFIKGMAHHYLSPQPEFILGWENVILIRHPEKLLASFSKVIKQPTIDDIGIKKASELFSYLNDQNKRPLVIDSDALLLNPEKYLQKMCEILSIPFSEKMLRWAKGGIPEDGVWAPYWYKNVHNSKGFKLQKTSSQPMPERLQPVLEKALPYYNILKHNILKLD